MQSYILMFFSILLTAVCWGIYGPILHWGQGEMGGGRMRTFICVGIAYFLVAIVVPVILMAITGWEMDEQYHINSKNWNGVMWSLLGGALGAVGALGIIFASTYSPFKATTPVIVMPLVFGLAPMFNTFFTMYTLRDKQLVSWNLPMFYAGLILLAAGAATVLIFAPKPGKKDDGHAKKPAIKQLDDAEREKANEIMHMTGSSNTPAANQVLANEMAQEAAAEAEESNS
jgi:gas vesicle protein